MKKETPQEEQLQLEIKQPFQNVFWKFKGKIARELRFLESVRYLRSSVVWACLFTSALAIYFTYSATARLQIVLPSKVPFLQNYILLEKRLIDTANIDLIWPISLVALLITAILTGKLYNRKEYSSTFLIIVASFSFVALLYQVASLLVNYT